MWDRRIITREKAHAKSWGWQCKGQTELNLPQRRAWWASTLLNRLMCREDEWLIWATQWSSNSVVVCVLTICNHKSFGGGPRSANVTFLPFSLIQRKPLSDENYHVRSWIWYIKRFGRVKKMLISVHWKLDRLQEAWTLSSLLLSEGRPLFPIHSHEARGLESLS